MVERHFRKLHEKQLEQLAYQSCADYAKRQRIPFCPLLKAAVFSLGCKCTFCPLNGLCSWCFTYGIYHEAMFFDEENEELNMDFVKVCGARMHKKFCKDEGRKKREQKKRIKKKEEEMKNIRREFFDHMRVVNNMNINR